MLTKPEVACAIIEGISSVREDEELQDFVVEVEDQEFKCHRLILSACSGFFRGLLRSGMRESQKMRAKLEGVTKETFTTVLETLYTGTVNLTCDNMLHVWIAADQLQITVVYDTCVDFITKNICNETVISVWEVASKLMHTNIIAFCTTFLRNNTSLENWEIINLTAKSLGSEMILSHVRDFIKKNYEHVSKTKAFLCLTENDLLEIIKSQALVASDESVVIESIFKWIKDDNENNPETNNCNFTLNAEPFSVGADEFSESSNLTNAAQMETVRDVREKCLEALLSETRIYLANSITLDKLSRNTLVMDNTKTKQLVMNALLHKSVGRQHGLWSKYGVYRSCSGLENVGVMGSKVGSYFMTLSYQPTYKWCKLPQCPYLTNCNSIKLIAYMTYFFVIGDVAENSILCSFVQNEWREVNKLPGKGWLGVAVEEFIYLINSSNSQVKRFDPRFWNCLLEDCVDISTRYNIEHICSYDLFIIAFCTKVEDETSVHCLDTRSHTWTKIDRIDGSAKNIVSFRKEKQLYVLQTNGNLWEVNEDDVIGVKINLVEVFWKGNYNIRGVIYINECLCYVVSTENKEDKKIRVTSKLFVKIKHFTESGNNIWSNIVPAVVKSFAL